jgi:hypothetical protein
MIDIDQLYQNEIDLLNDRISTFTEFSFNINNLFKQTQGVRNSLDLAQEYVNGKDYINGYKSLLHSISLLVNINEDILSQYSQMSIILKDSNGSQI